VIMITEEAFETATDKDFATGSRRGVANSDPSAAKKVMIIREASGMATMTASKLASKEVRKGVDVLRLALGVQSVLIFNEVGAGDGN